MLDKIRIEESFSADVSLVIKGCVAVPVEGHGPLIEGASIKSNNTK